MVRSGDQIGPYTLINKIGRGAFGTVWLSERRTTIATTTAALKIPLDEDIDIETIKHEANLWVRASGHPNVLPIIEANIYDDQVIIASEYAPDGSLESWIEQHGKNPSVEAAVEIICGVLAGLEHLHARNIIHRDLKPANILFQGNTPRLADFGISRVLKSTSQSSVIAGTPAYMAPEAFDGKRSEQTDIWSVGVIFYRLLVGRLPFPQADITSLVGAILSRNPDPLPNSVPPPLHKIIGRALAKDPRRRYQSAAEMRAALRDSSRGTRKARHAEESVNTISASPARAVPSGPPTVQHIRQGVNPTFAYLVIGLLALLAGGAIVAWIKSDSNASSTIKREVPTNASSSTNQKVNVPGTNSNTLREGPKPTQEPTPLEKKNTAPTPVATKELPQPPSGTWFVILGSFPKNDYGKAEQRLQFIRGLGYDVRIIDADDYPGLVDGLWVVVMGPYSRSYAKSKVAQMKSVLPDAYIKSGR